MNESTLTPSLPDRLFQRWFLACLLTANVVAMGIAELDRSWIAFGIAIIWGPILNGGFLLIGVVATLRRKKKHPTLPAAALALWTIGSPIVLCAGVSTLIFALGLHGC